METLGIDAGSLAVKVAIMREDELLACAIRPNSHRLHDVVADAIAEAAAACGVPQPDASVSTGYSRDRITASKTVTEITCHARGAAWMFPGARTIIDIGGQDSKVIRLSRDGLPEDFVMNDKCAAGTGRFLEVMAGALGTSIGEMGDVATAADSAASINSICTVFAESEVVSRLAEGVEPSAIVRGLTEAVARRVSAMALRLGVEEPVVMTGGVAKNRGVVAALEQCLGTRIEVWREPQIAGAIGAALIAGARSRHDGAA